MVSQHGPATEEHRLVESVYGPFLEKQNIQVCLGWGVEFLQAARHSCRQLPRMGEFLEKELEFDTAPGAQSVCLSSGISPRAHVSFGSWGSAHWQPSCTGAECTGYNQESQRDVLGVIPSGWRLREVYLLPIPFLVASPLLFHSTFPPNWGKEEKVTFCRAKGEQTNSWSLWCSTGIPLAPIISTGTFCPLESENHNVAIESPTRIGFHKRSLVLCKRRMN